MQSNKSIYPLSLKRILLKVVSKHPIIWTYDPSNSEAEKIWKSINAQLTKEYKFTRGRQVWRCLRRYYMDLLENRTIRSNTRVPTWELFHEMQFYYENAKEIIEQKIGQPIPKFQRGPYNTLPCPCCVPVERATKVPQNGEVGNNSHQNNLIYVFETDKGHPLKRLENVPDSIVIEYNKTIESMRRHYGQQNTPRVSSTNIGYGCVSLSDINMEVDDFNVEELDKLKDCDIEVLHFPDEDEVICIDDDD